VEIAKTPGRQKSAKKTRSHTATIAASAAKLRAINNEVSFFCMALTPTALITHLGDRCTVHWQARKMPWHLQ
jgi:hypothetical protein